MNADCWPPQPRGLKPPPLHGTNEWFPRFCSVSLPFQEGQAGEPLWGRPLTMQEGTGSHGGKATQVHHHWVPTQPHPESSQDTAAESTLHPPYHLLDVDPPCLRRWVTISPHLGRARFTLQPKGQEMNGSALRTAAGVSRLLLHLQK